MRILETGSGEILIAVTDQRFLGDASNKYYLSAITSASPGEFGSIKFQNGSIGEEGVNGCQQEDLLAIVIDRLQSFQEGKYFCRENAIAITKIQEALHWLNHRTNDRIRRGVEGTHEL